MPAKRKTNRRVSKKVTEQIENNLIEESSAKTSFPVNFKAYNSKYIIVIAIIIIAGLLYYFKGLFIAAVINGEPITRFSVINQLEKQGGKQTLQSLVTERLILQEAKKENVTVSDQEVNDELTKAEANLASSGQKLDDVLAQQGLTRDSVKEQIRVQKLVEKMLGKDIAVSDKEINDYISQNKDTLPNASDPATLKDTVKQQIIQQKIGQKFQSWISDLEKKANIIYFVNY